MGVIDPANRKLVSSMKLAKHPEAFQLEGNGPRIFINVPDAHMVAVVDRETGELSTTWPVVEAKANFPMSLDEAKHRLFIGCRQPAKLLCLDTVTGKTLSSVSMSGDVDDIFYAPVTSQLYASCGEGFLDCFQISLDSAMNRTSQLVTAFGARTCYGFPNEKWLALAVPHKGQQTSEMRIFNIAP